DSGLLIRSIAVICRKVIVTSIGKDRRWLNYAVADTDVYRPRLHAVALLTALCTFVLIFLGGMVTSKHAGMSVPDWPNSYGYNMFLFPPSKWVGGILFEHTHRLMGTVVGFC